MQPNSSELHLGMVLGQVLDRTGSTIDLSVEILHALRRMERLLITMTAAPREPPPPAWLIVIRALWGVLRSREGLVLVVLSTAGMLGVISPTDVKEALLRWLSPS